MKIIYHDQTGRHLAIVAAALHLQLLDDYVSQWDLQQLPYFLNENSTGTLLYLGLDAHGHEIYVLGRNKAFPIIKNAYLGLNKVFEMNQDLIFADAAPLSNWCLRLFDFLNRQPKHGVRQIKLLYYALGLAMPKIQCLVSEVHQRIQEGRKLDEGIL